jgi:sarcosine oxidase
VRRAYALWAELESESSTRLFRATGGLMIGAPESAVVSGTLNAARTHDLRVQTWTRDEIRQRVPALVPTEGMVGVFEPRAGVLTPEGALTAMLARASAAGATLHTDEPALEWLPAPGRVLVRTAAADYEGRHLVVAAGAWMPHLTAGLALPLAVERQVQYWFATHGSPRFAGGLPVFLVHTPGGRMLYGLPDQGQGLKLAEHHGGTRTSPEDVARQVTPAEREAFLAFASPWIDGLPGPPADASVCLYTNTPDGDFVLDRHPAAPEVYLVSACSGHGFKFAPAIGEAVVSELLDVPAGFDLAPFRISRFLV